jgi:death-on-curing protein
VTAKITYLTLENLIDIHKRQIEMFGGTAGIRDAGLIEAALLRPQTGYYRDLLEEAAALWESLTMNHGFVDGNKRVGFATTYIFLRINGYQLDAGGAAATQIVVQSLEKQLFTKDSLDDWLRNNVIEKRID